MKTHLYFTCILLVCMGYLRAQNSIQLIPFSSGYTSPLGLENCGDSRLFVVQKGGQIMICDSVGTRFATPFLDISGRVRTLSNEQGLLGLAFHPRYAKNGFFYVHYINRNGNSQISRFKVSAADKNIAKPSGEKKILEIVQPLSNHNGGCLRFGPDGYLYIGMGDGGGAGDQRNNAQNPASLLGKMLRIDINSGTAAYNIPPTNPFVNTQEYKPEIWASGLRNPWRWSFDAVSGALLIADVGQDAAEEINRQNGDSKGGENYGWRCYEANRAYNTADCKARSNYTFPYYAYQHSDLTKDCSVTGGFVYRGKKHAAMYGKYYFTDYCSGIIRSLTLDNITPTKQDEYNGDMYAYTSFGEDNSGELYVVNISNGSILRLEPVNTVTTVAAQKPAASLSVYPNPAQRLVTVSYTTTKAEACTISLFSGMGTQVVTAKKVSIAGKNNWQIAIPAHVKGECYITITSASGTLLRQSILVQQ